MKSVHAHASLDTRAPWWRVALVAVLAAPLSGLAQAPAAEEQKKEETVKLQAFEVTGSRIKRIDAEGPAPVVEITRADMDIAGYVSAADFLRDLPSNSGGNVDPQRTSTFASGATTANLRGLGSSNTLVLINGRRIASYGLPGGSGFNSVFDLNSIPTAAISSIELLKDGASALYGSDAVSGVINIKTNKNYSGLTTEFIVGNTTDSDSLFRQVSVMFGATTAKTEIVAIADYSKRNALKQRDRAVSANADHRSYGGTDGRSATGYPGRIAGGGFASRTFNAPDATPTFAESVPYVGSNHNYNFNEIVDNTPGRTVAGAYLWGKHQLTDNVYAFAELMFRRNDSHIENAASPMNAESERGTAANGQMVLPASNPFNFLGVDIVGANFRLRTVEVGPRTIDLQSDATRLLAGLGGNLKGDWTWEASVVDAESRTTQHNSRNAMDRFLQNALNGIQGPTTGRLLFWNPFGPNDPEIIQYVSRTFNRINSYNTQLIDATVSGTLADLPGGRIGMAFGLESRTEDLISKRSEDEQAGQIVGGNEGLNTTGSRSVDSAFAELGLPILKNLELQLAARYESYSDFGETTKPKVALSFRPAKSLLLRGSFSQSFKAPDLAQLYNGGTISFTSGNVVDPRRPADAAKQLKSVTIGNPLLLPEETDTNYLGFVFEPAKDGPLGFLHGLALSMDYFHFDGTNVITNIGSSTTVLNNELNNPLFTPLVIRSAPTAADIAAGLPGALLHVNNSFINASTQIYKGFDVGVRYDWKTAAWGRFLAGVDVTYLSSLRFGTFEAVDTYTYPRYRATASLRWTKGDWSASLFVNHIAGFDDAATAFASLGGNGLLNRIADHTEFNPQVTYRGFRDYKITLGARNAFDTSPPRSYFLSEGYDNLTHNAEGRYVFMRISKDW